MPNPSSPVSAYIRQHPIAVRRLLTALRKTIRSAAPDASEKISYQMPTFYLNGNLVHFAAHPKHIGFYPAPSAIAEFKNELAEYQTSKGAIQFPLDQPLPLALVARMVKFRAVENRGKTQGRSRASSSRATRTPSSRGG